MPGTSAAPIHHPPGVRPVHHVRTVVVGLPPEVPTPLLAEQATARLSRLGLTAGGILPHFLTRTRRSAKLVNRWCGLTCGGPIALLDLDGMRRTAASAAAGQWMIWKQVVDGTRPAQPFWFFADKHHADPQRYPFERVRAEYAAQPRVLAMATHNAVPHRPCDLPLSALEAFQAGHSTYTNLGWLTVVPADGLATVHGGGWLTTTSDRLADQLTYLQAANAYLSSLPSAVQLVALAIPI